MTTRYPARREPRVLAIAVARRRVYWAVADPWELRGAGSLRAGVPGRPAAIVRLARRERPTAIVLAPRAAGALLPALAGVGVPVVPGAFPLAPDPIATELFPEIGIHAPTKALRRVAVQAVSAVLHGQFPPRNYAAARHKTLLRPA